MPKKGTFFSVSPYFGKLGNKRLLIIRSNFAMFDFIGELLLSKINVTEEIMLKKIKLALSALIAACIFILSVGCNRSNDSTSNGSDYDSTASTPNDSSVSSSPNEPDVSSPNESVTPPQSTEPPKPAEQKYLRCTGDNVNLRSGAGTDFSIVGQAEQGTVYAITGKFGNWYRTYYRGKTAYIYTEYAAVFTLPLSKSENTEAVLQEAYKHVGVPYVYGAVRLHDGNGKLLKGFSAQKFDCSSLVQYVYYKGADKLLNTTTRTQVKQGEFVKRSNLQRGDCIYFTNESREHLSGTERVGHVAIYLGDNYILHTASDYARIEKMSAKRWSYYIEARRFV